jgi:hypothetical protein
MITIGIDPGARYTAVSVRSGDKVLLSSTYVRPLDMEPVTWAIHVTGLISEAVLDRWPDAPVGVEGVSDPTGFKGGKAAPMNPAHIIRTATVLGSLAQAYKNRRIVIVPPKKNGAGLDEDYPAELTGRRPATLEGQNINAGTRRHEKSAFDVAGEVMFMLNDGFILDQREEL